MKKNVLIAISLILVLVVAAAFTLRPTTFDNAKWTKGPCVSNNTITGMATGLGTGPCALHITGQYDCVNKGSNTPGSDNWSALDITIPVDPKQSGGNFKITATIPTQCDHANWSFYTRYLRVTLIQDGVETIPATDVFSCQ